MYMTKKSLVYHRFSEHGLLYHEFGGYSKCFFNYLIGANLCGYIIGSLGNQDLTLYFLLTR